MTQIAPAATKSTSAPPAPASVGTMLSGGVNFEAALENSGLQSSPQHRARAEAVSESPIELHAFDTDTADLGGAILPEDGARLPSVVPLAAPLPTPLNASFNAAMDGLANVQSDAQLAAAPKPAHPSGVAISPSLIDQPANRALPVGSKASGLQAGLADPLPNQRGGLGAVEPPLLDAALHAGVDGQDGAAGLPAVFGSHPARLKQTGGLVQSTKRADPRALQPLQPFGAGAIRGAPLEAGEESAQTSRGSKGVEGDLPALILPTSAQTPAASSALSGLSANSPPLSQSGTAALASQPASPAVSKPLDQIIDQLSETREAGRSVRPDITVRHSEFGTVAMRVEATQGDWRATLSARDSGFVPAIQAALNDRAVAPSSESASSHNNSGSRGHEQSAQGGFSGSGGEPRYGSSTGSSQAMGKPYMGDQDDSGSDQTAAVRDEASDESARHRRNDGSFFA